MTQGGEDDLQWAFQESLSACFTESWRGAFMHSKGILLLSATGSHKSASIHGRVQCKTLHSSNKHSSWMVAASSS